MTEKVIFVIDADMVIGNRYNDSDCLVVLLQELHELKLASFYHNSVTLSEGTNATKGFL
jgi:hypothetical protein